MKRLKKNRIYLFILLFVAFLSVNFVSIMGYLNYKTAVISLEERAISRLEKETVNSLETSISFGKDFESYYGIETIFESFKSQFRGTTSFVISADGSLLYYQEGSEEPIQALLDSKEFQRDFANFDPVTGGTVKSRSDHGVFYPIRQDKEVLGYYGCVYNEVIFYPELKDIMTTIFILDIVILVFVFIALIIFVMMTGEDDDQEEEIKGSDKTRSKLIFLVIMASGILILSGLSLYSYQNDYRQKMKESVEISLKNLQNDITRVYSQGVDIRTVDGLKEYISERVSSIDVLFSVRITEAISEVVKDGEDSDIIRFRFTTDEDSGNDIFLEAELSDKTMRKEMNNIILVLLSTMIILLIFAFELNNLVDLLKAGFLDKKEDKGSFSEKQVSLSLRFTGFLCATAEYMCVPYAAMMIRASGQSLFGLSVGMTAALPLTLEQFTLMISMFAMPSIVKRINVRKILVFSSFLMIACNVASFVSGEALVIVICRGIAGIAYCGFKQVSNFLITKGYVTETGRSENISQDNAGLLAGGTCGAGLGAILSANSGYASTFFFSAIIFGAYLLVTLFLLPWKELGFSVAQEEESEPIQPKKLARMFFSPEMLFFIILIGIPLNIGVMLCVTLIPAICQTHDVSSIILSYCYIANGLAGIYIGPALVSRAKSRFGLQPCIAFAFALTAVGIFILHVPPVVIMIVLTSMILGFLDGFGTPMVTDRFMCLNVVRNTVDESTSLVFYMILTFVLLTFAPMIAELMILPGKGLATPMMAGAIVYAVSAVLLIIVRFKEKD